MIIGSEILYFKSLPSTNTQASMLLKQESPAEGTVICTDFQTAGRGQPGNRWESESGKNLLLSIILYPESVLPEDQFIISMMVSLGLCDIIDSYTGSNSIKWPNDIYNGDGKIAGILIENSISGNKIISTIIGIGLNVNQTDFPKNLPNAVSIKSITGKETERYSAMRKLLEGIDIRYKMLLYGDRKSLRDEYISRLYRYGKWNKFVSGSKSFTGKITNITGSGKLRLEKENGTQVDFGFKEIDYII
jgi:BirA family biotin operon repressor/biotin-[acetyl-CoA-carboxylase] ligase